MPVGSSAANVGGYANPRVDELMTTAQFTPDRKQRAKLYSEMQKIVGDEVPIIWTHEMVMPTLYRTKVHDLLTTGLGMNENFADVWVGR